MSGALKYKNVHLIKCLSASITPPPSQQQSTLSLFTLKGNTDKLSCSISTTTAIKEHINNNKKVLTIQYEPKLKAKMKIVLIFVLTSPFPPSSALKKKQ